LDFLFFIEELDPKPYSQVPFMHGTVNCSNLFFKPKVLYKSKEPHNCKNREQQSVAIGKLG
jgi:hypothetical protein